MAGNNSQSPDPGEELIPVTLEPIEDRTDAEVLEWLRQSNVSDAEVLAPRFISATVPKSLLPAAADMARVSQKIRKQKR